MTESAISVSAPHGKGFYIAVSIFATLWGFAFLWGASGKAVLDGVPLHAPMVWRVVATGIAALFLIGALQAFERWLAPARAQARSAAISGVALGRLPGLHSVLLGVGVATSIIDLAVSLFRGSHVGDLSVLLGVFFFAGYLVADLCGERR